LLFNRKIEKVKKRQKEALRNKVPRYNVGKSPIALFVANLANQATSQTVFLV
jgi:hypothetical protein